MQMQDGYLVQNCLLITKLEIYVVNGATEKYSVAPFTTSKLLCAPGIDMFKNQNISMSCFS